MNKEPQMNIDGNKKKPQIAQMDGRFKPLEFERF